MAEENPIRSMDTYDKTIYKTSDGEIHDFADCVADGLPPRAMRYTMENKNNLAERGSIYVGLGETRETTIAFKTVGNEKKAIQNVKYISAKTGVLNPPTGDGTYVLKLVKNGTDIKMAWIFESNNTTLPENVEDGIKEVTQELK